MNAQWNWDVGVGCGGCGASLWEGLDRSYCVSPEEFLCEDCAKERGGVYDADADAWITPPASRRLRETPPSAPTMRRLGAGG